MDSNTISISRDQSAAIKGLLISLVVLGHNHFFVSVFPNGTWHWLYCFHVSSFFILPFFYPEHVFSWQRVGTYAKRLLWPYTWMFVLLFLANYFLMKQSTVDSGLVNTFFTGNEFKLKDYTGFQYLWFLPAMFSMLITKDFYTSSNKMIKYPLLIISSVFYVICWVFFFNSPYNISINKTLAQASILSFMLGMGFFFLGCTTTFFSRIRISILLPASVLIFSLLFYLYGSHLQISRLVSWLSRAICPVTAFTILLRCDKFGDCLFLRELGKLSLPVYLFHQPVNFLICTIMLKYSLSPETNIIISYVAVMIISYVISKGLLSIKTIYSFLFAR